MNSSVCLESLSNPASGPDEIRRSISTASGLKKSVL